MVFSCCAFSQTLIKGTVKDASGLPVPGVGIFEKGKKNGTTTDLNGKYQISVAKDATLVFSLVGYTSQEIKVAGKTIIDVSMAEDIKSLSEVVVVGYGTQKKESVLSAINQIDGTKLLESGSANLTNALNGVSPGLNIVVSSGQPGSDDGQIFIRGNANPLILVDGVEIVGGFSNINPRDVESISTLKDGAATAVYGIRGANGVIIITTKRGKIGKPKVSFSSEVALRSPTTIPNLLDAYNAQSALNVGILNDLAFNSGYSSDADLAHWKSGDLPYQYPNTDWFGTMIKKSALSQNQSIDVRGGTNFVKYYASAGYLKEGDVINTQQFFDYDPKFKFSRYSFRGNLDFNLTKSTQLRTSVSNRYEDASQPRISGGNTNNLGRIFGGLYTSAPGGVVPYYPAEVLAQFPDPLYPGLVEGRFGSGSNPFADINTQGVNRNFTTVFNLDLELEQKLDFLTKGLSVTGKYNYTSLYNSSESIVWNQITSPRIDTYTLNRDGTWFSFEGRNYERPLTHIRQSEGINSNNEIGYQRLQFNYDNSFGKHNVTGLALVSRNKRLTNTQFPFFNEDYVSRFTYNYAYKYFFEVSGSYNGDETFARGYRFKFFPSVAVGYNLAREKFISDKFAALNNFKIRYSYGRTGDKSGLGNNRYQYLSFYDYQTPIERTRYYFGVNINDPLTLIGVDQLGNPTLTWATVTKQNLGIDFGLFDDKISGTIELFKEGRDGLISRRLADVPGYFGSSTQLPFSNFGASKSHGIELTLSYRNKTSFGLNYNITGFYAFNENRILFSAADGPGTPQYTQVAGKPDGVTPLLKASGYFQNIDELVNYPYSGSAGLGDYRYVDYNANGSITGDPTQDEVRFNLPIAPSNSFSLNLGGSYKGWSLSALVSGVAGHKGLIDADLAYALPSGNAAGRFEQLNYWTPSNPNAAYPALHTLSNPNLASPSTARIIDLDYIKLRSLSLGYAFDLKKSKTLSNLRLYVSGNDLLTISKVKFGDPEGNSAGSIYPIVRRVNFGINVGF
ncbi:SusC/RagA family TonB-linked outer membrane protein [Pedobacter segetis]|nr:TonB-dependent receptor [Pedobacter segetis]